MDPKELPAEQVVVLGFYNIAEPDRHDRRVTTERPDINAVTCDRIERIKVHHILARLAVDPVDRGLDRQKPKVIAEILRHRVKDDDLEIAANREQDNTQPVLPEIRFELECARQNLLPQKRTRTMSDDDDLPVTAFSQLSE